MFMKRAITWFCDVNDGMGLHSVNYFYAILQYSFTLVTIASDFQEFSRSSTPVSLPACVLRIGGINI